MSQLVDDPPLAKPKVGSFLAQYLRRIRTERPLLALMMGAFALASGEGLLVGAADSEPRPTVALQSPDGVRGSVDRDEPAESEDAGSQRSFATGDWGGTRRRWEHAGLIFDGLLTFDSSGVLSGDLGGETANRGLLQVGVGLDLQNLLGLRGATFFAGLHSYRGGDGSGSVGDIQGYSNIDASEFEDIAEVWYEQRLLSNRVRLKIGRMDANSEFAHVVPAEEFLNSSAGFSPTVHRMPTYPRPVPGVNVFVRPAAGVYFGTGLFDRPCEHALAGDPSRARFAIAEAGFGGAGPAFFRRSRIAGGVWRDSESVPRFGAGIDRSPGGFYALFEHRFSRGVSTDRAAHASLDFFLQFGHSDERSGEIARHLGMGVVSGSPFGARESDVVGAMVSFVDLSDSPDAGFQSNETAIELFYGLSLTPFLRLKPDLQYIRHPSGDSDRDDAVVGTVRLEIAF